MCFCFCGHYGKVESAEEQKWTDLPISSAFPCENKNLWNDKEEKMREMHGGRGRVRGN